MSTGHVINRSLALDGIRSERELGKIIQQIIDALIAEEKNIAIERGQWIDMPGNELEKLATLAELKIRIKEVNRIKKSVLCILRRSTNNLIIATLRDVDN